VDSVPEALRHSLRRLVHRPGLTTAIVLILTLGIGVSTAILAIASIAFFFTSAFEVVYLLVAIATGVVLLVLTAKFLANPNAETAWAGYKFSGLYLALLLLGIMADAIFRIPA